jgi:hypothetical protein
MTNAFRRITAIAVLATVGCGVGKKSPQYAALGLVEVSGTVTLDGEPLEGAMVVFENPQDKTLSFARTNGAGGYKLMFNSEKSGCTPGRKVVRVTPYREPDADPDDLPKDSRIPARYGRQSELTADVSDANRTFDFALTSK